MSSFTSSHVRVRVEDVAMQRGLERMVDRYLASSTDLRAIAQIGRNATDLQVMHQQSDAISSLPGAVTMLNQISPDTFGHARQLMDDADSALRRGDQKASDLLAHRGGTLLSTLIADGITRARHDERFMVAQLAREALTDLGYQVTAREGEVCNALVAEQGHTVLALLATDGGQLDIDVAGLTGGQCVQPVRDLQKQLRRRGLDVTVAAHTDHGDDQGGAMIRRATARTEGDLVDNLIAQYERPSRKSTPQRTTSRARGSQRAGARG